MTKFLIFITLFTLPFNSVSGENRKDRIGLYTGTFDPPHINHLKSIEHFIEEFNLDELYIYTNYSTPHKKNALSFNHRQAMLELAVAKLGPKIKIHYIDENGKDAYTKSGVPGIIEYLHYKIPKSKEVFYLLGSDSLDPFLSMVDLNHLIHWTLVVNIRKNSPSVVRDVPGVHIINLSLFKEDKPLSSSLIRESLTLESRRPPQLPEVVFRYILDNNLIDHYKSTSANSCSSKLK